MDPLEEAVQLANEAAAMLQQEPVDWDGLKEKLKLMRNKVGECQPAHVYGQPVTYTQPSDSEIDGWNYTACDNFTQWVLGLPE